MLVVENNDIFDLSCSKKEMDFLKRGLKVDYDIIIDIIEVFSGFPFVSSLVKLGMLGNKYFELQFIRKVSRFLQKDVEIPIVPQIRN